MIFFSPLEQFRILPIFSFKFLNYDFSFTNSAFITFLTLLAFVFLTIKLFQKSDDLIVLSDIKNDETIENNLINNYEISATIAPKKGQIIIEFMYELVIQIILDTAGTAGEKYFPFLFTLFSYIFLSNLVGLIPYSFTSTSHIIVTFALALSIFIAVNIICINNYGIKFFTIFLPGGTSLGLALLLVPIEFISYFFKPISLSVRLFANIMAGHTLLKVIAGFAWAMMTANYFYLIFAHFIPLITLILLIFLELAVALIQTYVFVILTCIYLNDAITLSH